MSAVRSALFTGGAHASKVLMGFILLKVMAVYLGPEGVGKLGHLMSVVSVLTILSGGGIINALVKYCSEYHQTPRKLLRFISAAVTYALLFSLLVCIAGIVLSRPLSLFVFGVDDYQSIIILLAIAQLALAFANVVFGVTNGLRVTHVFAYSQILGNVLAVPLLWFCISRYLEYGAGVSIVLASSLCALPALYFYRRSPFWGRIRLFKIDGLSFRQLFAYTTMLVVSTLAFPLVEITVRSMLISQVGYHDAGIWQAAIRFSAAYLGFFTMFLAFYFVPRISPEQNSTVVVKMTLRHLYLVQAIFVLGAGTLYLGRTIFIKLIFSEEFSPLADLIIYQLLGDFFKISAYVIGFIAVAKAATKLYIIAEVLQGGLFLLGAWLMSRAQVGVESVMQAYVVTYILYFVICLIGLRVYMRKQR
ncbi:O-antigen translocase [Pseudomonas sp. B21-032]|uniref:O-antigen translocase n=1 Tax=Pseudomonas sp. B21-032 TaxID=2895483 RepID=UPI00215E53B7|nr:O-antigen translocase [Pseudomonas sp. B21-032]UVL60324.1 O-antigen translocase [Pseudomonas sp. B21-032]